MRMNSRQRGLSLIELMIGILLSSLLLLGVLQVFDSNRDTMRMQMAYSRAQESGRFAIDFLTREIRMADFWGCAPNKDSIQNHLDESDSDYKAAVHGEFGANGVRGKNNITSGTEGGKSVRANTDTLTLSGAENACGGTGRMVTGEALHVSPACDIQPGQIVLISNCKAGELMTITNVQASQTTGESGKRTLVHTGGRDGRDDKDEGWIKNLNPSPPLQEDYGTDSTILRPYSRTFFIANSDVTDTPSLFMSEDGRAAQELIPGIEDMQVRYGRDSTGNGVVDTWQDASNSPEQMEGVAVIRVQLLVASDGSVGVSKQKINGTEYTDGRLRKLYTATAKIRNRGI
ncbi:PilW family protein [Microbulbifer rhizosphaerae]|uniref:Type IV pilus assembly protein PilW n=1 Tax=Microbulbifer rhizosphaerae TaxID=1562603 RepID=A0A7W4Z8J1_9GAMM|nr:PilW family protein [Microbulbifer rhizosphaerae]MBB3060642.1 type IV pilus assembly protein PilW [Microbulbifer rhizosphaerae]